MQIDSPEIVDCARVLSAIQQKSNSTTETLVFYNRNSCILQQKLLYFTTETLVFYIVTLVFYRVIVVALKEKIAVFDAVTFEINFWISRCYPCTDVQPIGLGGRWLAYTDKGVRTFLEYLFMNCFSLSDCKFCMPYYYCYWVPLFFQLFFPSSSKTAFSFCLKLLSSFLFSCSNLQSTIAK